ncbi:AMP-binding protein [Reticulibacter mediterranei]|uniref:AMP-binding protein n=1 Tax=Reticulibacter mediterranei TaxID=2778369 RepID=A0A8J3INH8_9CHLR|nr:AMP-binding protein [Reticulibacter mediterranei]GHO93571.1 AMP-binding protein [Reticulibacter mediterranei]
MSWSNSGLSYWQADHAGEPLLETTVGDLLDRRAQELPEHEALVYSCYPEFGGALDIRWTYREYCDRADEVARGLMALGLKKGEHIAVWAINLPEWTLLQMAAAKVGLVLVTINSSYRRAELEYILKQSDVVALFFMARMHDQNCLETISSLVTPGLSYGATSSESLPALRYVCLLGTPPPGKSGHLDAWRPALFREMLAGSIYTRPEELRKRQSAVQPSDPMLLLYTSGTTGSPKGVVLSHFSCINNAIGITNRNNTRPDDRNCCPIPFFHAAGCMTVLETLYQGTALHPMIAFDPQKMLQIISSERCTTLDAVPTMLIALLQQSDFSSYDLSSLRLVISGSAPVPAQLMEEVKERIGADIAIVFGQTEASSVISQTVPSDSFEMKATTVGTPLPHVEVKIVQPTTRETVPWGESGELCCRGYLVMQGYYKMLDSTRETIDREGWLHTGDLATMDQNGYIRIVGRLKEMIIRGGENIYPREIEELLQSHPKVMAAQVIGVPDQFFGEELAALIIPQANEQIGEDELKEFCRERISHQKVPRYIQFVASYPMTASGKVQKYLLRRQAMQALGLEVLATASA